MAPKQAEKIHENLFRKKKVRENKKDFSAGAVRTLIKHTFLTLLGKSRGKKLL